MEVLLQAGRSVVLAGDLNIAPFPIDHCDLVRASRAEQESMLRGRADRAWFRNALQSAEGPFVDLFRCMLFLCTLTCHNAQSSVIWLKIKATLSARDAACLMAWQRVGRRTCAYSGQDSHASHIHHGAAELGSDVSRKFHPNRLKSYTVWNMKTNARPRNHGSRVDFILAASGQKPPGSGDSNRDTPDKVWPTCSSLPLKGPPAQQSQSRLASATCEKKQERAEPSRGEDIERRLSINQT